jgi:two-component system, OmpR family, alkaline phosphatase synthesis response regulator PhoP
MSDKILVIEDEPTLSRLLTYNLTQEGYEVSTAEDGAEGLQEAIRVPYDLIILDIMLPTLNGFEVLSKLREKGDRTPVIVLTARNDEKDIVQGLKFGADDYMTKPFGVAELLARVSAVLRRTKSASASGGVSGAGASETDAGASETDAGASKAKEKGISIGDLTIYPERYEAYLGDEPIPLRRKEFEVLMHFVQRPGIVITRDDLMNMVWGFDYIGGQRTVDVHVSSLRKKLEDSKEQVQIESIRGIGYKLTVAKK